MRRCSQRLPDFRHSSQPSALGVTSFSIDPYQLGFENDEALD